MSASLRLLELIQVLLRQRSIRSGEVAVLFAQHYLIALLNYLHRSRVVEAVSNDHR